MLKGNMDTVVGALKQIVDEVFHLDCIYRQDGFNSVMDSGVGENQQNKSFTERDFLKVLISVEHLIRTFHNNYDSRFNIFFERIFQQIQSLYELAISDRGWLKSKLNQIFIVIALIVDIIVANPTTENLNALVRFYTWNVNEIKKKCTSRHDDSEKESELVSRLKLVSVIYEEMGKEHWTSEETKAGGGFVEEKSPRCQNNRECRRCLSLESFTSMLSDVKNEINMFSQLVSGIYHIASTQTLLDVIPKYIIIRGSNGILESVWNEIMQRILLSNKSNDNSDILRTFTIMCYLSDLFFTVENKHAVAEVFKHSSYWFILQSGLTNSDYGIRKQAVFLMRRSIYYVQEYTLNFSCLKEIKEKSNQHVAGNILISWDSKMGSNQMDDYLLVCLIIEYLEEKQLHIVSLIFDVINKFMERNGRNNGSLDLSWVIIIIQRMLSHDSVKIMKEGILQLLRIPISMYENQETMTQVVRLLISHLNCTQLYATEWLRLDEELRNYFALCSEADNGNIFFKTVIEEVCRIRWSSEALFFFVHSLRSVAKKNYWGKNEVILIRELVQCGTCNHYTYIKSGMQCQLLVAGTRLINIQALTLDDIAVYLDAFPSKTSLRRGTKIWEIITKWISEAYPRCKVEEYLLDFGEEKAKFLGKMIVVLSDAGLCDTDFLRRYLDEILAEPFAPDAHLRPYRDSKVAERHLRIISDVAEESLGDFTMYFKNRIPYMLTYVEERLLRRDEDVTLRARHLVLLETLLKRAGAWFPRRPLREWAERIIAHITNSDADDWVLIKTLNVIGEGADGVNWTGLRPYLERGLKCGPTCKDQASSAMKGDCIRSKWEAFARFVDVAATPRLTQLCMDALDVGGRDVLVPVMAVLGKILPSVPSDEFEMIVHALWSVIAERKKNEEYHQWTEIFVKTVFQVDLLGRPDARDVLLKYSRKFLSEVDGTVNAGNTLMKHMEKVSDEAGGCRDVELAFYSDTLPRALLYGRVKRKVERLVEAASSAVEASGLSPLKNDSAMSNEIRARGIAITLKVLERGTSGLASSLVDSIIEMAEERCANRVRYFSDSHIHRVKQRLIQSLLLLECYVSQEKRKELWEWSKKKVTRENNQRSVRYLLEWLILRILAKDANLREDIWKCFDEGSETRTGSLCSLFSLVYHSAKLLPRCDVGCWIKKAVETCLPYCMAQHYSVRLYAQVTLRKLLEFAAEASSADIGKEYEALLKCLRLSLERGSAVKNCAKLEEDFYYAVFHPVNHFSLESIFCHIPRLTSVNHDEWVTNEILGRVGFSSGIVPMESGSDSLALFPSCLKFMDGEKCSGLENLVGGDEDSDYPHNLQKKIIPTKCLLPDWEESSVMRDSHRPNRETDGIIVVASLIDRLPNLGGLSRTCEVFGVSQLVLPSLKYAEDKQFQSLSVTAEKWITLKEVKPYHLSEYLSQMKGEGYTILCAEQTVDSVPLQDVKFPKKSVLVLGNEREGIPPPLILQMDACIEVPQLGVIRSLNVHVTGALFIWEYAKQHTIASLK